MLTWGLVTIGTAFVHGLTSLAITRFLLGVAEAGFSWGMLYLVSRWFPSAQRGTAMSWVVTFICPFGLDTPVIRTTMIRTTPPRPPDIEEIFPALSAYQKTSTRLHPRPGSPAPHEGSIGGPLLWPAHEPWPTCPVAHPHHTGRRIEDVHRERAIHAQAATRGSDLTDEERQILAHLEAEHHLPHVRDSDPVPLLPLAQIFTTDVPDLEAPGGADLLQVLWCPFDAHGTPRIPGIHLLWRDSLAIRNVLSAPPAPEVVGYDGYVPEPCVLNPEQVREHPYIELLPHDLQARIEDWEMEIEDSAESDDDIVSHQRDLSIAPGWKVGGYAKWNVTGPEDIACWCGSPMQLLLTIASHEWDGTTSTWTPQEDRAAAHPRDVKTPTQVRVGRAGSLNVFRCPVDAHHENRFSLQ